MCRDRLSSGAVLWLLTERCQFSLLKMWLPAVSKEENVSRMTFRENCNHSSFMNVFVRLKQEKCMILTFMFSSVSNICTSQDCLSAYKHISMHTYPNMLINKYNVCNDIKLLTWVTAPEGKQQSDWRSLYPESPYNLITVKQKTVRENSLWREYGMCRLYSKFLIFFLMCYTVLTSTYCFSHYVSDYLKHLF